MIRIIIAMLAAALLAGCATDPKITQAMLAAHQAAQAQPTITLRCPAAASWRTSTHATACSSRHRRTAGTR